MQVSTSYNSTSLSLTSQAVKATLPPPPSQAVTPGVTERVEISEAALKLQSGSLSIDGTASGNKGDDVAFSLGLGYLNATAQVASATVRTDPTGASVTVERSTAEVKSASFSFAMSSQREESAHLNDEVSAVGKEIRPEVKEFLSAAGMKGGWGQVNRFLRSVA